MKKIGVLGAGNIGLALARGLAKNKFNVFITRKRNKDGLKNLKGVTLTSNEHAVSTCDYIVIAVRPDQVKELAQEIAGVLKKKTLIISIVSGISITELSALLGGHENIVRAMPNTAIEVGQSMTCLAGNEDHLGTATEIFSTVGQTMITTENMFAEITVLCGSGTAIVLKFLRIYMQAGIHQGIHEEDALKIATQVIKGATILLEEKKMHPEELVDKVTTPAGCTITALVEMEKGFSCSIHQAIERSIEKAKKLYQ